MRGAFGKPQGVAARVLIGQILMSIRCRDQHQGVVSAWGEGRGGGGGAGTHGARSGGPGSERGAGSGGCEASVQCAVMLFGVAWVEGANAARSGGLAAAAGGRCCCWWPPRPLLASARRRMLDSEVWPTRAPHPFENITNPSRLMHRARPPRRCAAPSSSSPAARRS
jgi:hypothetical protein